VRIDTVYFWHPKEVLGAFFFYGLATLHSHQLLLLDKFGWGAVFFASWIPVIGDFILISAGAKKMKFTKFIAFMISGKVVKTIAVVSGFSLVF